MASTTTSGLVTQDRATVPVRVLLLENSPHDVELQLRELRNAGFQVEHDVARTRAQFRETLLRQTFDAVLSDYRLPHWTGLDAFDEMRQLGVETPFLLVTGTLDEEAAVECIKRGINNHVLKEHLSRLPVALERALKEKALGDEQHRAGEALRDSEASFRLLFADSPLPMWVYDHETLAFLQVNDAAVERYGYSREEFLRMKLTDIRQSEEASRLVAWMAGHPEIPVHAGIWRHQLKNGQFIQAEISQHRLPFAGRDAVLVVAVDVTEKLRAVGRLAASENRLRAIVEAEPQCVKLVGLDGTLLEMNAAGLAMIEASHPEQVIGKYVYPLVAPAHRERFRALLECIGRGESGVLEFETQGLKGTSRWLEMHAVPFRSESGEIVAALSVTTDVTERKRVEQALRESEARAHDLVENATYAIFRATAGGHFLDVNPALVHMLGFAASAELCSANLVQDVFRYPEQYASFLLSCREKGRVSGIEAEWRRKDGASITVRLGGRLVETGQDPDVLEGIAEDVTELRVVEKQLRQAQKFEAVGQLAGGIAHDFNNVVGAILGWAEIGLEHAGREPRLGKHFTKIREQAERAATLTRQLLAFARQQVLQPRPVDLNSIVANLLSFLDRVIGRDIEVRVATAPSLELVRADPTQIEQVLMNLCLNARDAMPQGGRLLIGTESAALDEAYCRYYPYAKPGRYAVLSVSDTGIGMDAATRERIFEPFFTTKESGKGTGLGLATVYGIVKQHGGFVQVYSEPGQGSLFRVYLPTSNETMAPTEEKKPLPGAASLPRGSETILVAEDHDGVREIARQVLSKLGYHVLCAANGEEAVRVCEHERPALAILDVIMPKLNGPAAYDLLQTRYPTLPVIFTTGYTAEQVSLETRVRHGGILLQKPYSPTALGRMVREILDRSAESSNRDPG